MLYILAESVATRLWENGFSCRVVEISIRNNEMYSFTRQHKLSRATNITSEIAEEAFPLFRANYDWRLPVRSVDVRVSNLVTDGYYEQLDLFTDVEQREKMKKMDEVVDVICKRFGFYSIQRGLMYQDRRLSSVNAREEHTVHPNTFF